MNPILKNTTITVTVKQLLYFANRMFPPKGELNDPHYEESK